MGKVSLLPTESAPTTNDYALTVDVDTTTTKKSTWATIISMIANNLPSGTPPTTGWNALASAPNTIVANGNRSYTLTFNSVDYSGILSPGMRLRTTRTVAAPNQCTSLNGTTQYWSKTSPAGMTGTDDYTCIGWIKLSSYPGASGTIISKHNGSTGWYLHVMSTGQLAFVGQATGTREVRSYQQLPLNKWVHVYASLDMSGNTTATNKIMIDGVDVPAQMVDTGGTPTAWTNAGNLEIGSRAGGTNLFPGKLAQVAVFSANSSTVTEAIVQGYISQGLGGSETSLISAYSFSNSFNDLNANANNLTANGSATATTADSPFGGQAGGSISTTLDYAVVGSVSFSTNTTVVVQCPNVNTIPTSGGVSAVAYSPNQNPFGFSGGTVFPNSGSRSVSNAAVITLTNTDQDLASSGLLLSVGSPIATTVNVTVSIGASSTTDFEFRPEVRVNGTAVASFTPLATLSSASGRAISRTFTASVQLASGNNLISAGVFIQSATGPAIAAGGAYLDIAYNPELLGVA